jgi:hypothetical protein
VVAALTPAGIPHHFRSAADEFSQLLTYMTHERRWVKLEPGKH